jgi:copper chaperone
MLPHRTEHPMTTLSIPDMTCGHCKAAVEAALGSVAGVASVTVDLAAKRAATKGTADTAALLAALADAGYPAAVLAD